MTVPLLETTKGNPEMTTAAETDTFHDRLAVYQDAAAEATAAAGKAATRVNQARNQRKPLETELKELVEVGHARVDALVAEAEGRFAREARSWLHATRTKDRAAIPSTELIGLHALADPTLVARLHAAIDADAARKAADPRAFGFSPRAKADVQADLDALDKRIRKLESEAEKAGAAKREADKALADFKYGRTK